MTQDELKEILTFMGYEDSILFENPSYTDAVIGINDNGQVCYSFDKMVEWLVKNDSMTEEDAMDFIYYNTIRALPYCQPSSVRPTVIYNIET